LEGAVNFRDLGGYEGLDGRTIKWRHLFRADGLSHLSSQDHEVIRKLGVATVIDLRTFQEVERDRFDVEATPVTYHHVPFLKKVHSAEEFENVPFLLRDSYAKMLSDASHEIRRAVEVVADETNHPVIFHCAAGKDRTGVLAALLLGLLGVADETIVEDYALTARAMGNLLERLIARNPEIADRLAGRDAGIFSAEPENMERLLGIIHEQWGPIEAFAASIGIESATIDALRSGLLEPA
jgi:protein-tyrosine phosphatase